MHPRFLKPLPPIHAPTASRHPNVNVNLSIFRIQWHLIPWWQMISPSIFTQMLRRRGESTRAQWYAKKEWPWTRFLTPTLTGTSLWRQEQRLRKIVLSKPRARSWPKRAPWSMLLKAPERSRRAKMVNNRHPTLAEIVHNCFQLSTVPLLGLNSDWKWTDDKSNKSKWNPNSCEEGDLFILKSKEVTPGGWAGSYRENVVQKGCFIWELVLGVAFE